MTIFISTTPANKAIGEVRELYLKQQGAFGYLPNYAKVFCHRPDVMEDWASLQNTIRKELDPKDYELIVIAAALAINNSYCALAHCKKLLNEHYSEAQLEAIIRDTEDSPLSETEKAIMALSRQVAIDSSKVSEEDIRKLQNLGFSDRAIFNIVSAAAARCFFAKIGDALGVQPDAPLGGIPSSLKNLLARGRPVSESPPDRIE